MEFRNDFLDSYQALEQKMEAMADSDGDVFLPNLTPAQPADAVLICMEPSLGYWAKGKTNEEMKHNGKDAVDNGFRNFIYSLEDFIVHFCAKKYLCNSDQSYHITDLSKGAMLVNLADNDRTNRYDRWHKLLEEEIALISHENTKFIAFGNDVFNQLNSRNFPRKLTKVIHFSGQAASARAKGINGYEDEFKAFANTVSLQNIIDVAEQVLLDASVPEKLISETLKRLQRANLTDSRLKLVFNYKKAFEAL